MEHDQVRYIYYSILSVYDFWSVISLYVFTQNGTPKLMTKEIANIGNISLGFTAFQVLHLNRTLLPPALRPRWYHQVGTAACGVFYLGMATLVFVNAQWPVIRHWLGI